MMEGEPAGRGANAGGGTVGVDKPGTATSPSVGLTWPEIGIRPPAGYKKFVLIRVIRGQAIYSLSFGAEAPAIQVPFCKMFVKGRNR